MENHAVIDFAFAHSHCQQCSLFPYCQPTVKRCGETEKFHEIKTQNLKIERGEHLFRENSPFNAIYSIRSGSFKTYTNSEFGKEQILGFYFSGTLLGLNALSTMQHIESALALETCSVCKISLEQLEKLKSSIPAVQPALLRILSEEIQYNHQQLLMISKKSAEARLAKFLLTLSNHFRKRGFSATEFNLSMTRNDIAGLLGLAVETVSRIFTHFQEAGLLTVNRRNIVLLDIDGLMKSSSEHTAQPLDNYIVQKKVAS